MPVKKSSAEKGQELINFSISNTYLHIWIHHQSTSPRMSSRCKTPHLITLQGTSLSSRLTLSNPRKCQIIPSIPSDHGAFIPVQDRPSFIFIASLSSTCHQHIPSLHPTSLSQSIFFLNGRINGLPRILCIQKKPPKIPFLTQHVVRKPLWHVLIRFSSKSTRFPPTPKLWLFKADSKDDPFSVACDIDGPQKYLVIYWSHQPILIC